mgnify:FL=1
MIAFQSDNYPIWYYCQRRYYAFFNLPQKVLEVLGMYFQRLTDLRQDHDLTQQQIADILHCQREVYRRYEKGTREIPISYAIILAKFYKVSLDYLCGLSDKK